MECVACHKPMLEATTLSERHKGKVLRDYNHAVHLKMGNVAPVLAAAIDKKQYLASPQAVDVAALRAQLNTTNACQACHRGLESATGALVKANFPHMEDCLVCHNKIDAPFSCEKCHGANVKLKPVNHSADFLDQHTTGKLGLDKSTCASCHGKRFTCLGCH